MNICRILRRLLAPMRSQAFIFVGEGTFIMSKTLIQGSTHTATALFTDADGNQRPLHSVPAWTLSDPNAATLTPSDDGMTCEIVAGTVDGDYTLTVKAEGDPTTGVNTITGNFEFTVVDPEDTQVSITID